MSLRRLVVAPAMGDDEELPKTGAEGPSPGRKKMTMTQSIVDLKLDLDRPRYIDIDYVSIGVF